jgi:predicted glycosyltransferase
MKDIDFYLSIENFSEKLKLYVAEQKNLIPIESLKNSHRLISYVDFLVARGGFNTITEIIKFNKPALLINEKNNPEIKENLKQMKKLDFCSIMQQSSFKFNFQKKIYSFIKNDMKRIKNKLKSKKIKSNGATQIVENIVKNYEKN